MLVKSSKSVLLYGIVFYIYSSYLSNEVIKRVRKTLADTMIFAVKDTSLPIPWTELPNA